MSDPRTRNRLFQAGGASPHSQPGTRPSAPGTAWSAGGLVFTPGSSQQDPEGEHRLRQEVEAALLARDHPRAQSAIAGRLRAGRYRDTALHLLGILLLCQGDGESGRDCLGEALRLREESPELERRVSTRCALALAGLDRGDFEAAWEHLDRALCLDPGSLLVLWNRDRLAGAELDHRGPTDALARDRLAAARAALRALGIEAQDPGFARPFLLSLK